MFSFNKSPKPPVAQEVPKKLETHGHVRSDEYFWLNQREDQQVLDYLEAENEYTEKVLENSKELQNLLYEELKSRVKKKDQSAPYFSNGYFYYQRYEASGEYPIYCRRKTNLDSPEEVILDVNLLAKGHEFFQVGDISVSYDNQLMAYSFDTQGRRKYEIKIRNLATGNDLPDLLKDTAGDITWFADNSTFLYAKIEPETLREGEVYSHKLGEDVANDRLVYKEDDETFYVFAYPSRDDKYIFFMSSSTQTTEVSYLSASEPLGLPTVFQSREKDHRYSVDFDGQDFFIRTNWQAPNYRLMKTTTPSKGKAEWEELVPHSEFVFLTDFEIFSKHLVLQEKHSGLNRIRVLAKDKSVDKFITFDEELYSNALDDNEDYDLNSVRITLSSMKTPETIYDVDLVTGEKTFVKQAEVANGYDESQYENERVFARARDGKAVAISLVYKKGMVRDGKNPLLLYAYGSYGSSIPPYFSANRLSLLDRGFVYAIAHIRGSQTFGKKWYEEGKLLNKKNTFTDYIDCAQYLMDRKYTRPDKLFAMGGSAGGLLMGAVMNMRPDMFKGVLAAVPFVDVVTTMLDDTIPLTTFEYDEWGNPNKKVYYDYMLSYSPYDQVKKQAYPNVLVTTGLHDSQVQYWEPAKWVAKLRTHNTGDSLILLKTDMSAGHSGKTGRYHYLKDIALEYAFILGLAK